MSPIESAGGATEGPRAADGAAPPWAHTPLAVLERLTEATLLEFIRGSPCIACGAPPRSDVSHIRSRGAGGPNVPWNMIPFCRLHHVQQHQVGWNILMRCYPRVRARLLELGWQPGLTEKALWHPGLAKRPKP